MKPKKVEVSVPARIGLWGNPSDGFDGKVVACTVDNFTANVSAKESEFVNVQRNWAIDPIHSFDSLPELSREVEQYGYLNGRALVMASCKKFMDIVKANGLYPIDRNFEMKYSSSIPRQVGLGGSSALIIATIWSLAEFYNVTHVFSNSYLAQKALEVEVEELGLTAGPQDRVIQSMGGLVYMDFSPEACKYGTLGSFASLSIDLLPEIVLAYTTHPTHNSSSAHSPIKDRYKDGDSKVMGVMNEFANNAEQARRMLERDIGNFDNFNSLNLYEHSLRSKLYEIDESTQKLVEMLDEFGVNAKQTGSGGAVFGVVPEDKNDSNLEYWKRDLANAVEVVDGRLIIPNVCDYRREVSICARL